MNVQERNIALCIIFTIITCGIYSWYWLYKLAEDGNAVSGREDATSPGMVLLLTIITCGIYGWYWLYKTGDMLDKIKIENGASPGHLAILYLVLSILGLGIISYALMQSEFNEHARSAQ